MFRAAALRHRKEFEKYVDSMDLWITIRQPPAKPPATSSVDRVFGHRPQPPSAPAPCETCEIRAVWTTADAMDLTYRVPPHIATIGRTEQVDLVLRVKLSDVLVDSAKKLGRTLLDTAQDVVIEGSTYKVLGVDRTGLPPEGPYIAWAALQRKDGP